MRFFFRPLIGPLITWSVRGISLALWSHDQFKASHWSTPRFLFKFVSVLLSASVERVGVSRMQDFCLQFYVVFSNWYSSLEHRCHLSCFLPPDVCLNHGHVLLLYVTATTKYRWWSFCLLEDTGMMWMDCGHLVTCHFIHNDTFYPSS